MNKNLLAIAGILAVVAVVLMALLQAAAQPKITWSPESVDVTLSPGETASRDLTFVSDTTLKNAVLETVPKIAPFASVHPSGFTVVSPGQAQPIRVSFAIPANTRPGSYEGTLHLNLRTQTIPQTLKVTVRVWTAFAGTNNAYTVKVPPGFEPLMYDNTPLGPDTPYTLLQATTFEGPNEESYLITIFDDTTSLPIEAWIDEFEGSVYPPSNTARHETTIQGYPAMRLTSTNSQRDGTYFRKGTWIICIEWTSFDAQNAASIDQFSHFLDSFQIGMQ